MSRRPVDTIGPAVQGRAYVRSELEQRGWTVHEVTDGGVTFLEGVAETGARVRVRVKSKRSGTWQPTVTSGRETPMPPAVPTFWMFVDLGASPHTVFIAPDEWVRRDIYEAHAAYLRTNGGHRARNDASSHHAISAARLEGWRGRWDLLRPEPA
ncbi:hypothetical protein rosag_42790 [Roseisolibacter agri]|uniref:Uncharacterized protein n=1 Tax=Roseisolibacter agri TaxID=2014610 RepID=A0AA37QDI8_9BACT|nr:hypothetical protein rosag_42790 [Roseisolibacter agri]